MRLRIGMAWLALLAATPCVAQTAVSPAFDALIGEAKTAMMADPAAALAKAIAAEAIAAKLSPGHDADVALATADWLRGEALARTNQPEQALPVLETALAAAGRSAPREKLYGDILLSRGWAEGAVGRVKDALDDFQHALMLYRAIDERRGQAKALQYIGSIYSDAGEYERSLRYYAQVPDVYQDDPAITLAAYNNVGETLKKLGRYQLAERNYQEALDAARQLDSPLLVARILTNLASAQFMRGQLDLAQRTAGEALRVAAAPDAASWRPYAWGVLAQVALKRGDLPAADRYIAGTFANTDLKTTPLAYRDFHETAAQLFQKEGKFELAFDHLAALKRLDDEARQLTASANAALQSARFEFANQERRITESKARISEGQARLRSTILTAVLIGGGTVLTMLVIGIISLTRSRNQVRAVNVSLERALKVKTEFLAMTSHEIRTPLNGILGMTQVLLADRGMETGVRDKIQLVHGAGETMKALVDDILDVAKIDSGNLTIERGPVDLRRLLEDAGRLWRGRAETKGLALTVDLTGCPARIEEDEGRLRQIVFNLMSNATKFTEAGSVELKAATQGTGADERLVIVVKDTGIGIAEDQHELIFEKFRQVDGSTNRKYGGTGLGLAICRELSTALGGTIGVDSRLDHGATFTVVLPVTRLEAPEVHAPARAETLAQASLLLVDANPLKARMLRKALLPSLGSVDGVDNFAEALAALEARHFDHVLVQADMQAAGDQLLAAGLEALIGAVKAKQTAATILFDPKDGLDVDTIGAWGATALARPIAVSAVVESLGAVHGEAMPIASAA